MSESAGSAAAATALVLCKDPPTRQLLLEAFQPFAIRAEMCEEVFAAISLLEKQKFEAVVVDLLLGERVRLVMDHLHVSRVNRTAVSFAITSGDNSQASAPRPDSTFVLHRPLTVSSVTQILRAAYGLVVRERRRYFRCPVMVPIFVRAGQREELVCQTVNLSEGGLAIRTGAPAGTVLPAAVRFSLPERTREFSMETRVCWQYEGTGLTGLEFKSIDALQKSDLQEWLARKLDETLPENVVALFRAASQSR